MKCIAGIVTVLCVAATASAAAIPAVVHQAQQPCTPATPPMLPPQQPGPPPQPWQPAPPAQPWQPAPPAQPWQPQPGQPWVPQATIENAEGMVTATLGAKSCTLTEALAEGQTLPPTAPVTHQWGSEWIVVRAYPSGEMLTCKLEEAPADRR